MKKDTSGWRENVGKQKDNDMDKDRIVGLAKQGKGTLKESFGKAFGDAKLVADGKRDQAEGKVQNAVGSAKDAARDAIKK